MDTIDLIRPEPAAVPAPSAALAADAPRSLLGRPATRHRGTEIDGATLAPEGLWVRGKNLNELIGAMTFEAALAHLWFDAMPGAQFEAQVRVRLARFGRAFAHGTQAQCAAAFMGAQGVGMVFAAVTGFLRGIDDTVSAASDTAFPDADFDRMLACVAAAPYLMRAALDGRVDDRIGVTEHGAGGVSHAARMLLLTGAKRRDAAAEHVMNALLTAWHAGFGYITPTVLAPRVAIGTGVTLTQSIAAGFMASGPSHVGAALEAMTWLRALQAEAGTAEPVALRSAGRAAVNRTFDTAGELLFGFGHPLFVADPRPAHLRSLFAGWGFHGPCLTLFDACCEAARQRKGLNPNIDFLTAAVLLDLGVSEPAWGVGVGLCSRIAAMAAHAVERRQRPAFGVNSATARKLLAAVPVGWL
jgi:citrate synthase